MKGFLYGQTEYNILASSVRLDEYIKRGVKNHFDFLSITDRNLHAAYKFYNKCKKNNIKPIIGLEVRIKEIDNLYSKVLFYAKNNNGYKNLLKLDKRIKVDSLESLDEMEYSDLIKIFVLDESLIQRAFISNDKSLFNEYLEKIKNMDGYLGYSSLNKPELLKLNNEIVKVAKDLGVKIVPIHHLKYLDPEDSIIYEALVQISGSSDTISEFDDFSFLDEPFFDDTLNDLIESINLDLYQEKILLPTYPNTKGKSSYEYLHALCHKGLERRGLYYKEYLDRLAYELDIIHRMGYDDYFLIVWDFILFAKKNKVLVGPGRGSAAGSLVSYCLGITEIDPLKYGLLFERFLNPERVSMPDIDTDFPDKDRDFVINHVKELFGEDHVCNITAFGTFKIKSSVRELSKVFKIEPSRIDKIIDMIEKVGYDDLLLKYKGDELYQFLYVARGLEGLPKHISTHPAGIILSKNPLDTIVPLQRGINDLMQSEFEASDLEEIGLLKMDFLGISNLTMIDGMVKNIPDFEIEDLRKIPLDDPKVYKMLREGDTLGIFQMEKPGFRKALKDLKPSTFNDIVAILALYRPGPMDNIPTYIERKEGKSFQYLHKDLEPILKETYGVIVYQEQIMQIAKVFAGYSLGEADLLRRAVSKKDASKLEAMRSDFISKSVKLGYSLDIATSIYDLIYKFANYGFNKSHSVAYAMFAYEMAYLKVNYFYAFMPNIMNNVISNTNTLLGYISYAKQRGLVTQKPNINISTNKFEYKKNWLFLPLTAIFSIGESIVDIIVKEREANGLFKSFEDFINRCNLAEATVEALVYSGALDIFGKTKKSMLKNPTKQDALFMKHIKGALVDESEFDFNHLREMEKKYLGINLEYNLFKNAKPYYKQYNAITIANLKRGEKVNILFVFQDMKEITTKRKDLMLLGSIEDEQKSVKFTIFPSDYKEIKKVGLFYNSLYVAYGGLELDNKQEETFVISKILKL